MLTDRQKTILGEQITRKMLTEQMEENGEPKDFSSNLEERSDDALCRAPAVPGILPRGKIVEGEKAAGVYEGAEPPVLKKRRENDSFSLLFCEDTQI